MADQRRQIQQAAARRSVDALGLTSKRVSAQLRRWGQQGPPISLQAAYFRTLTNLARDLRAAVRQGEAALVRAVPGDAELTRLVQPHGLSVIRWNRRKYDTPLGAALGLAPQLTIRELRTDAVDPDLESRMLASWTRENVALIKNATSDQAERITAAVLRAGRAGTRARDLEAEIANILKVGKSRAKLIARDQVNKFSGQLDRVKQTEAGIDAYIWRTSADERVRASHQALNGRRFTWVSAPAQGHPGQPVQCRCQAEPDLTALLGDDFAAP